MSLLSCWTAATKLLHSRLEYLLQKNGRAKGWWMEYKQVHCYIRMSTQWVESGHYLGAKIHLRVPWCISPTQRSTRDGNRRWVVLQSKSNLHGSKELENKAIENRPIKGEVEQMWAQRRWRRESRGRNGNEKHKCAQVSSSKNKSYVWL